MPIILALRRPGQDNHKFKPSVGYTARPCLKKKKEKKVKVSNY
jgi:hypothetical protein